MKTTEDRVVELEREFKIADYKLDTLIDSVKEVSFAVHKLAEVSTAQTLIQARLNQVIDDQADIRDSMKERAKVIDPIIEKGKTYMTMVKVWAIVGVGILGIIQTLVIGGVKHASETAEKMDFRIVQLERRADVLDAHNARREK